MSLEEPKEVDLEKGPDKPKKRRKNKKAEDKSKVVEDNESTEKASIAEETPEVQEENVELKDVIEELQKAQRSQEDLVELARERVRNVTKHYTDVLDTSLKLQELDEKYNLFEGRIPNFEEAKENKIIKQEELDEYKRANELIVKLEEEDPENPVLEKAKEALRKKAEKFEDRIIEFLQELNYEKQEERKKIVNDMSSRLGLLEKRVTELDEDPKVQKTLIEKMKEAMDSMWKSSEEGKEKRKEDQEKKENAEKEKIITERDEDIRHFMRTTLNVEKRHKEIFSRLKDVLSPEAFETLREIMNSTVETINSSDFDRLMKIREEIIDHILTAKEDDVQLKETEDLVPWSQKRSAPFNYRDDSEFAFHRESMEVLAEAHEKGDSKIPNIPKLQTMQEKIKKLRGEHVVFKVLIGRKYKQERNGEQTGELTPVWQAFETRAKSIKSGVFETLQKSLQRKKEQKEKREEVYKKVETERDEREEAEQKMIEAMESNPDFTKIRVPHTGERRLPGGGTKLEKSGEYTVIFVKFRGYKNSNGKDMVEIEQIIIPSETDNPAGQIEFKDIKVGSKYNLDVTMSSLPEWLRPEVNTLKSKIDNS